MLMTLYLPMYVGHIYEPDGIDLGKLKTIMKIKSERGKRANEDR
jgi:hypothetical protein